MTNSIISNTTLILWRSFCFICVLGCLVGCQSIVPASSPPQLEHTPSTPITITHSRIENDWFTLDYPNNWRVVTNMAIEPLHLILVSADETHIIHVEDARDGCFILEVTPEAGHVRFAECVGDDPRLYVWGEQISELEAEYKLFFDQVVNSVTFR